MVVNWKFSFIFFAEALRRVEKIAGRSINFHECDITSEEQIDAVFQQYKFWAVIHFAALKVILNMFSIPNMVWWYLT